MLALPPAVPLPPPHGMFELNALKASTSTVRRRLPPSENGFDRRKFTMCRLGPRSDPYGSTGMVMLPELGSDGPPDESRAPNSTVRWPGAPRYAWYSVETLIFSGNS